MHWFFVDKKTLREKESGFTIHLVKGTWDNPIEIKQDFPPESRPVARSQLLIRGLEYAFDRHTELAQA